MSGGGRGRAGGIQGESVPGLVPGDFPAFDPIRSSSYSSVSTPDPTLTLYR